MVLLLSAAADGCAAWALVKVVVFLHGQVFLVSSHDIRLEGPTVMFFRCSETQTRWWVVLKRSCMMMAHRKSIELVFILCYVIYRSSRFAWPSQLKYTVEGASASLFLFSVRVVGVLRSISIYCMDHDEYYSQNSRFVLCMWMLFFCIFLSRGKADN